MNENHAAETIASGVTIVSKQPIADTAIEAIIDRVASNSAAARRWDADDDAVSTLAFASDAQVALTIVRRETHAFVSTREDLVRLLGAPVHDVLRIDIMLRRSAPAAFALADAALVDIAHQIVVASSAIVVDDLGSVFDPAELARLARLGQPRSFAFSYQLAAARRASESEFAIAPPALPHATVDLQAPRDPQPDFVSEREVVFAIPGAHVSLVTLARLAFALAGDDRVNPRALPVAVRAEWLAAAEALRLAAMGVLDGDPASAMPLDGVGRRDAVDVLAGACTAEMALATLRRIARDGTGGRVTFAASGGGPSGGFPHLLASFELDAGVVDVSFLDLARASAVFRSFVGSRHDLRLLLGGSIESAIAIEYHPAPSTALDAFAVSQSERLVTRLAHALAARTDGVVSDAAGIVFGVEELAELVALGRARSASWSARVVDAEREPAAVV